MHVAGEGRGVARDALRNRAQRVAWQEQAPMHRCTHGCQECAFWFGTGQTNREGADRRIVIRPRESAGIAANHRRRIGNGWQLVEVNTSTGNATLMPVTQTGVRAGRYVGLQYATAATPSFRNGTGINPADHAWPPSSQAFRFNDLGGVVTLVLTNAQDLLIAN